MRKTLVTKIVSSVVAGSLAISLCMGANVAKGLSSNRAFGIGKITINSSNTLTNVDENSKKMQLQGMCRGMNDTFYMFKVSPKSEKSDLYSYKIGKKIQLVKKDIALTGHANDAACVNKNFTINNDNKKKVEKFNKEFNNRIYVVTSNKGDNSPEIVSMNEPESNKNLSMKKYSVFIDGKHRAVSQIAYYGVKEVNGEIVPQFIIRLQSYKENNTMQDANHFYVGYLSTGCNSEAYNGRFVAEKQFKIDKDCIHNAVGKDFSYALGGMYYKDDILYITAAKKDKKDFVNESFIFYYDMKYNELTNCNKNTTNAKRIKIESSNGYCSLKHERLAQGRDKFEIEGIHATKERIYFGTNNIDKSNDTMKDALYYTENDLYCKNK